MKMEYFLGLLSDPPFDSSTGRGKNHSYLPIQEIQPGSLASCECDLTLLRGHSTFLMFLSVHGLWEVRLGKPKLEPVMSGVATHP